MNESLLDKIRALLLKAEDPASTTAEAEAYSAKAEELIAKHAIDQALLDAGRDKNKREHPEVRRVRIDAPYGRPKSSLYNAIAKAHNVQVVILGGQGGGGSETLSVVGFPSDLDTVDFLFASLLIQAANGAARVQGDRYSGGTRAQRSAFYKGFAARVGERLRQIAERTAAQAQADAPGTALVLRDRALEVHEKFKAEHPRTRNVYSRVNSAGYHAGREAGGRADLGQNRFGGGRTAVGA